MLSLARTGGLVRRLEKFNHENKQKKYEVFLEHLIENTPYALPFLGRMKKYLGFKVSIKERAVQKIRVHDASEKAQQIRIRAGYRNPFSYIGPYISDDEIVDESRLVVSSWGREFLTWTGFSYDLWHEVGPFYTIVLAIGSAFVAFLTGSVGVTLYKHLVCPINLFKPVCSFFGT